MSVTRTIEVNDLSPGELAELFCEMDSDNQGLFFDAIHEIAAKWPGAGWCQQSCAIAERLPKRGRDVIEKLAEHVLGYDETLEALTACRDQFDFYAAEHRKAEKHEKAATNERFAFIATQALNKARGEA